MGLPPARGFFGRTTTRVDMNHSWSILFRQTWIPRSKQFLAYNLTKLLGWGYELAWEERRVTFKQGTEYPLETFPSQQRWRIALPLFVWCEIPSNLLTFHWHPGGWVIKWNKEMPLFNITVLHFGTVRGPLSRWTQAGLCSCGFQGGCVLNKSHVSGKEHLKVWISKWSLWTKKIKQAWTYTAEDLQHILQGHHNWNIRTTRHAYKSEGYSQTAMTAILNQNHHSPTCILGILFTFDIFTGDSYPPSAPPDAWVQRFFSLKTKQHKMP